MNNTNKGVEEIVEEYELDYTNYEPDQGMPERVYQVNAVQLESMLTSYREQGVKAALEGHGIESGEDFNQATARFEAVTEAIIKKGTVWLSESGNVITDEEYHDWRDFVDSVAKPEGSVIEKYIKINLKALTTQEDQLIVKE